MVEATEFPQWAEENAVYAVPRTIVRLGRGPSGAIEGAVSEDYLIRTLKNIIEQGR